MSWKKHVFPIASVIHTSICELDKYTCNGLVDYLHHPTTSTFYLLFSLINFSILLVHILVITFSSILQGFEGQKNGIMPIPGAKVFEQILVGHAKTPNPS